MQQTTIFALNQDILQLKGTLIAQQSVSDISLANEKRLNASLADEVKTLRTQMSTATALEAKLEEDTQILKSKLDQACFERDQTKIALQRLT